MSVQHRLDPNKVIDENLTDFCLPAVFMPYKATNNIFNPKAHQYFHPSGKIFLFKIKMSKSEFISIRSNQFK